MFDDWSGWFFRSPFRRRIIIRSWRVLLRVQRATLASAVLVVRRPDGSLLAFPSSSGRLGLPRKELDGWRPIGAQVEEWFDQIMRQAPKPKLQAIDGTPGRKGVTFLIQRMSTPPRRTPAACGSMQTLRRPPSLPETDVFCS